MHQSILTDYPSVNIRIFVVWIQMYAADTIDTVKEASMIFAGKDRVTQYFDPEKHSSFSLARSLGASDPQVAWDVYLFFDDKVTWLDHPPMPIEWVHQLQGSNWADPDRLFYGNALSGRIREIMSTLNPG